MFGVAVAVACAVIGVFYAVLRGGVYLCRKDGSALTVAQLNERAIGAVVQLLSTLQYALAMASCFHLYDSVTTQSSTPGAVLAAVVFLGGSLGFVAFGVHKTSQDTRELADTDDQDRKPMDCRYGAYYDDYAARSRYFFVAKIGLEILSGAVVGAVQDATDQIQVLLALNALFLSLVILCEPFQTQLHYYAAILSSYVRIVLLLVVTVQVTRDALPQSARDLASELTVALHVLLFFWLLARQAYVAVRALCQWYRTVSLSFFSTHQSSSGRSRKPETRLTLQELIAAKMRDGLPAPLAASSTRSPPQHQHRGDPSHWFV